MSQNPQAKRIMRKGHIKILEKAKAADFPYFYINYLEQSELPLKDLEVLYDFLRYRKKNSTIMLDDLQIFDIIFNLHLRKNQLYDICYYSSYLDNKTTKEILLQPRKIVVLALKIKVVLIEIFSDFLRCFFHLLDSFFDRLSRFHLQQIF